MPQADGVQVENTPLDPAIWRICTVVMFAPLMTTLDSTIVNVSLASISNELHSSISGIQWVVSGYLLALALVLPLNGWLVEKAGAKRLYIACFSGFTLASALCGFAQNASALVAARILQGIMGGLLAPMAQMMIARIAGRHLPRVAGVMSVPVLLGPIFGPVLGGLIIQHFSWRWNFFINLPIGIIATWLAVIILPKDEIKEEARPFDWLGFMIISPSLVMLLYSMDELSSTAGKSLFGRTLFAIAVALFAAFIVYAGRRGKRALVDISLFRRPVFNASSVTQFCVNAGALGGQMLLPLYMLLAAGLAPAKVGLYLAPAGLGMLCCYPMLGWITDRFGIRRVSFTGALVALLGTLPFALFAVHGMPVLAVSIALFVRGMGLACIGVPSMSAAYASLPKSRIPAATTAINIVQRLGGPVATMALAILIHAGMTGSCSGEVHCSGSAFAAAFWLLCAIHAATMLSALRLPLWLPVKHAGGMTREENLEAMGE